MIRTLWCVLYVVVSMLFLAPFGIIALVLKLLGLRRLSSIVLLFITNSWGKMMLFVSGHKVQVQGQENIPSEGGVCFVSNHSGFFDIALLLAYCSRYIAFIAKRELIYFPVLNLWIALLGGLFIDRKNPRKALRTINAGVARIKAGGAMLIFPEGHRSRDQGLLPFHPGSLKLATQSEAVIVPVAITGTYNAFERNYRVTPSSLSISFCRAISTAGIPPTDRKAILCDQVYAVIKDALGSR